MQLDLFREKYDGWIVGAIVFILSLFLIKPTLYNEKELIENFPAIGLGIFGFMLTFIAIILQSDNETIRYMKSSTTLFERFISYNKRVVCTSAALTMVAYVGNAFIGAVPETGAIVTPTNCIEIIFLSIFWAIFGKMIVDLWKFIKVFYLLLKK